MLLLVDLLGYKEMARDAQKTNKQQEFLTSIHSALSIGRRTLDEHRSSGGALEAPTFALKAYTDNVVIGFPIASGNITVRLTELLEKVAEFQFRMVTRGYFVRGAISLGKAYIDDITVVGNAFSEAYEAEQSVACNPRIILADSIKALIRNDLDKVHIIDPDLLLEDSDGLWFVNYLHESFAAGADAAPFCEYITAHKEILVKRRDEFRQHPKIHSKYTWAAGYHNFFCDIYPAIFDNNYKIETDAYMPAFRRIR